MRPLRRTAAVRLILVAVFVFLAVVGCIAQRGSEELDAAARRDQFDQLSMSDLASELAGAATRLAQTAPAARFPLNAPERFAWDFWPSKYPGARIDQIAPAQQALADRLLRLSLSASGYESLQLVQALEPYNPWRSPFYSAAVFGEPAEEGSWGWRFQGHHVSLNFTLSGGAVVSATPLFLGTQPLSKPDVGGGRAPLGPHENLARQLYRSLTGAQRRQADVSRPGSTYLPLRTPETEPQQPSGISSADLQPEQRETLTALLRAYIETAAPAVAESEWGKIEAAGLDDLAFAWAGPGQSGRDHYYRVQGPTFILEYDSRDGGSHIHCVWRSFQGDFGRDVLAEHYAAAH